MIKIILQDCCLELRVNQWSMNIQGSYIIKEQYDIIKSLIEPSKINLFPSTNGIDDLLESIKINSKQFQVTMFLLCDFVQSNNVSSETLKSVTRVGKILETVQMFCHDLNYNRIGRDLDLKAFNSFLAYCVVCKCYSVEDMKKLIAPNKSEDFSNDKPFDKFSTVLLGLLKEFISFSGLCF